MGPAPRPKHFWTWTQLVFSRRREPRIPNPLEFQFPREPCPLPVFLPRWTVDGREAKLINSTNNIFYFPFLFFRKRINKYKIEYFLRLRLLSTFVLSPSLSTCARAFVLQIFLLPLQGSSAIYLAFDQPKFFSDLSKFRRWCSLRSSTKLSRARLSVWPAPARSPPSKRRVY